MHSYENGQMPCGHFIRFGQRALFTEVTEFNRKVFSAFLFALKYGLSLDGITF
jgi:hypothetical protein